MKDRIAGAPGACIAWVPAGEYQKLQEGKPFGISLARNDQPEVEGTPYSKATVLPDEVANKLCPDIEDPTPADAFDALSTDFVIEQGVSGDWMYRLRNSGVAECWGEFTETVIEDAGDMFVYLPFAAGDTSTALVVLKDTNEGRVRILDYTFYDDDTLIIRFHGNYEDGDVHPVVSVYVRTCDVSEVAE